MITPKQIVDAKLAISFGEARRMIHLNVFQKKCSKCGTVFSLELMEKNCPKCGTENSLILITKRKK